MSKRRGDHLRKHGYFSDWNEYRHGAEGARPVTLAGKAQEKPIFSHGKRQHVVSRLMEEMADWRSTPFENEAPFVHAMRMHLCLAGHSWRRSNAEADFLVGRALKAIGIPRPSWDEGQRSCTDGPDRCARCAGPIDDAGSGTGIRYCSVTCAMAAKESMAARFAGSTTMAYRAAERTIRKCRTKARVCLECGASFQPARDKSKQRFCSHSCGAKNRVRTSGQAGFASAAVVMSCLYCGSDFEARQRKALTCSTTCRVTWLRLKIGKDAVLLRPHVFDRYVKPPVNGLPITAQRFDFMLWQDGNHPPPAATALS